MAKADREIAGALAVLDSPIAAVDSTAIVRRARRGGARWRLAITGGALFAATAAAAMPGSPVRRWLFEESEPRATVPAPTAAPTATTEPSSASERGVAIVPSDSAEVAFDAWQDAGEIAIRIVPERELRVRALGGTADFVVRPNGVRVRNAGSRASYELLVPATVAHVRVSVAGRQVFARRAGDAADSMTVSLGASRR